MVAIFIAISRVMVDSGFSTAIVQKNQLTEEDEVTAFWVSFLLALVIYVFLYALAPLVASFYDEPRLVDIIRVLALSIIAQSLFIAKQARLVRALDLKAIAIINLLSSILAGLIAYLYVITYRDVYAIVLFQLSLVVLRWVFFALYKKTGIKLLISRSSFKALFGYSSNLLAIGVLDELFVYAYVIVIGKVFDDNTTGLYSMANMIVVYSVISVSLMIEKVSLPVLSRAFHADKEDFQLKYWNFYQLACMVIFPLVAGLIVTADSLIGSLLSNEWAKAAPILQILAVSFVLFPVQIMLISYFKITGNTRTLLISSSIGKLVKVVAIAFVLNMGLMALLWSNVVVALITLVVYIIFFYRKAYFKFSKHLSKAMPFLISSSIMAVSVELVKISFIQLNFIWQVLLGMVVYVMVIMLFGRQKAVHLIGSFRSLK